MNRTSNAEPDKILTISAQRSLNLMADILDSTSISFKIQSGASKLPHIKNFIFDQWRQVSYDICGDSILTMFDRNTCGSAKEGKTGVALTYGEKGEGSKVLRPVIVFRRQQFLGVRDIK